MKSLPLNRTLCALFTLSPFAAHLAVADTLVPTLPKADQVWTGADLWANPMEDWVMKGGKATNTHSGGDRELVVLTAKLNDKAAGFEMEATFTPEKNAKFEGNGFLGFQIGLKGYFDDYRDSAIYGNGFAAGVNANGQLFIGGLLSDGAKADLSKPLQLKLIAEPQNNGKFTLTLTAGDTSFTNKDVDGSWLQGLVSFTTSSAPANKAIIKAKRPNNVPRINQKRGGKWLVGISEMSISGDKVSALPKRHFGPIYWTQHTLQSDGTLNLIVQLAPTKTAGQKVSLEIDGKEHHAEVDANARVAKFVIKGLDTSKDHAFKAKWNGYTYPGTVRKEPLKKENLTVAALSCNDSTGFPHNMLVDNVAAHKPDVLAFMGDQIYEPIGGYGLYFGENNTEYDDRTTISYLRKYAMHGWSWRGLMAETPTFAIPDDHDVFHGNIWGEGGKLANREFGIYSGSQDTGGYKMSAGFVNAVTLTQTGSLPAAADPAPAKNGINVYFTDWKYAGIDMAILADRQFKSAPKALLPQSRIVNGWPQNHDFQRPALKDPKNALDVPAAELLGKRQEAFLAKWAKEDTEETTWRLVISATPLMTLQSIPEDKFTDGVVPSLKRVKPGEYPETDIPKLDYDSNGWPQSKRDLAADLITKAGAVHITGDQHLGSTGQYGVKEFNDSAWWISSPAIANLWPRRWFPKDGGENRRDGAPKYTGEFFDGFGNMMTLHAASNPYDIDREPSRLFDKAVGYSIITLHRKDGSVTLENWPYYSSPSLENDNKPYPGWPITIDPKTNKRLK